MERNLLIAMCGLLIGSVLIAVPANAQGYTFTTFDPPRSGGTYARSINDLGSVAGFYVDGTSDLGFLRDAQGNITTFAPPGSTFTVANTINASNVVAGWYQDANNAIHGFVRGAQGSITTFDVGDLRQTFVYGINDSRVVTGYYAGYIDSNNSIILGYHGYVRDGNITTFDPPGSIQTYPSSINSSGAVAGTYSDANGTLHGFLGYAQGKITTFDPQGSTGTTVSSINVSGTVAGVYTDANNTAHGFLRDTQGNITAFDPLGSISTTAYSINASGVVVGSYRDASNTVHGFVRDAQGRITTFDPPGSVDTNAISITSSGVVAGYDAAHGFIAYPNGPLTIPQTTLVSGTVGSPYSQTLTATGGTLPYSWSVASGSLPDGLNLDVNKGAITGTPSTDGTFNFTVRVTDSTGATASSGALSIQIGNLSAPTNLQAIQVGVEGTQVALTWNYGSDQVDGFVIEHTWPSAGGWFTLTTVTTASVCGPSAAAPAYTLFCTYSELNISPFEAKSYQVSAYQGSTSNASPNSAPATAYQLKKCVARWSGFSGTGRYDCRNASTGTSINVDFTPDSQWTLHAAARTLPADPSMARFDHFNWLSWVEHYPKCYVGYHDNEKLHRWQVGPFFPQRGPTLPAPHIDPPPGGWFEYGAFPKYPRTCFDSKNQPHDCKGPLTNCRFTGTRSRNGICFLVTR